MKPDLLVTWIKHCDYPIFRYTMKKYRSFFGKVIICFSEHWRFPYYDHFIRSALVEDGVECIFLDPQKVEWGVTDWRNVATNAMLKHSDSEWVCSIEQDWFAKDWERLLEAVAQEAEKSDLIGWYNPTNFPYVHPAFWFIRREMLEKTNKDFGPHPEINGSDHFAMVTREALDRGARLMPIQTLGFVTDIKTPQETDCFHLGGVNQNYLEFVDRYKNNGLHRPDMFYLYNRASLDAPVPWNAEFFEQCKTVDAQLDPSFRDSVDAEWGRFFKLW